MGDLGDALVQVTKLSSGLTVATQHMPSLRSVALGVWVGVGARHETLAEHGLSHLLEHMAFKGTERRSARDIVEEIEQVGGDMNAATSIEQTAYYVRALHEDVDLAVDVLADIVRNSTFDADELLREKDVVLQEIAGLRDSPDDTIYDLVQDAAFPDHSIGRSIIGTPESVSAIGASQLRSYLARHYSAGRMVVAASGYVDHDRLVESVRAAFDGLPQTERDVPERPTFSGGIRASDRPFEQAHLMIGWPSPAYVEPDFLGCQVLSAALGGGMSSRLFQEVREARGLCYSIYSSAWGLSDAGFFTVHAATGEDLVAPLADVIVTELDKLAAAGLDDRELARAKAQLRAGLMMSLESPAARAEQLARQILVHDRVILPDEIATRIDAVSAEDVRRLAQRMRDETRPAVAVVGAGAASDALAAHTARLFSGAPA
ncbi:MAG: pitrilysin family protein [Pseudomonadota bacterium]